MVVDSIYNIGDTVWAMRSNYPTEFIVAGIKFDSDIIGSDRYSTICYNNESIKNVAETIVKYYLIEKSKVNKKKLVNLKEGKSVSLLELFDRSQIECGFFTKNLLFNTKEELVYSLLK